MRRRVQQEIHGHRGRKNDPLYGIRMILRCGQEKLTDRQRARLDKAIAADERHDEVLVAWLCAQQLRSAYKATSPVEGRRIAEKVLASLPTCPIPEIKRLGKTLKQWREAFLAYFDTGRANNGGTEAINGLIELHRRIARGFRNREHYRLRMLLIGGGLAHPHLRYEEPANDMRQPTEQPPHSSRRRVRSRWGSTCRLPRRHPRLPQPPGH